MQKPSGGDREAARDVAAGKSDIGIVHLLLGADDDNDPEKKPGAEATKVILLTSEGGGTHVHLSASTWRSTRRTRPTPSS